MNFLGFGSIVQVTHSSQVAHNVSPVVADSGRTHRTPTIRSLPRQRETLRLGLGLTGGSLGGILGRVLDLVNRPNGDKSTLVAGADLGAYREV